MTEGLCFSVPVTSFCWRISLLRDHSRLLSTTHLARVHNLKENNPGLKFSNPCLERTTPAKLLGVTIQENSKWEQNINAKNVAMPLDLKGHGHCAK